MSPPRIVISERLAVPLGNKSSSANMECSRLDDNSVIIDDLERNSNCDTASVASDLTDVERNSNCDTVSVASDLTRMCVSDEDEKEIIVLEKTEHISNP